MASTRARTWSLRCANVERSAASDSWRWRSARFSSLRASTVTQKFFDAAFELREFGAEAGFGVLVVLGVVHGAGL